MSVIHFSIWLVLWCLTYLNVQAQSFFQLPDKLERQKIQFELYRNIIVIPIYLNESGPYNFILDSGAGHCILTDPGIADSLHLIKGRELRIKGAGEASGVKGFLVHEVNVKFENVSSVPLTFSAFETDPFLISSFLGIKVHGILGFEFFNSFVIDIDFRNKVMVLTKPEVFKPKKSFDDIPIYLQANKPYVKAGIIFEDSIINLDFLLDTGAGFPISLESNSNKAIKLPSKTIEAELGVGLNGPVFGIIGRVPTFVLGNYKMNKIVTGFPDYMHTGIKQIDEVRNGSIGNFVLNRFRIILDYSKLKLYLKPATNIKKSFPFDRTGIEVVATGNKFKVLTVQWVKPDSPAFEAGILPGDEILEINARKASSYNLTAIDHLLSDPGSESIVLKISREKKLFYVVIFQRDLI